MREVEILRKWFEKFHLIGKTPEGGVTRLGYTVQENEMHSTLKMIALEEGFHYEADPVGNSFVYLDDKKPFWMIGSHLDSVPNGGCYDGVAGVLAGLLVLKWIKESRKDIPLKVVAFRCEESSRFGRATIGSSFMTGKDPLDFSRLMDSEGKTLFDAMQEAGFSPEAYCIEGVQGYLELHIEQGRVLEEKGLKLGIVTSIAAPTRFRLKIIGKQEHSGTTPMGMRRDALVAAAEVIRLVEELGLNESGYSTVATVGTIKVLPGAMNVIPGYAELGIDIRGVDRESIKRVIDGLTAGLKEIALQRKIEWKLEEISKEEPVVLDEKIVECLENAARLEEVDYLKMASGAGHDAMVMAKITKAGMLFIPCKEGISHNPNEEANFEDILTGARVMLRFLEEGCRCFY